MVFNAHTRLSHCSYSAFYSKPNATEDFLLPNLKTQTTGYLMHKVWDKEQAEGNTTKAKVSCITIFLWLLASKFPREYDNHFHIWPFHFKKKCKLDLSIFFPYVSGRYIYHQEILLLLFPPLNSSWLCVAPPYQHIVCAFCKTLL